MGRDSSISCLSLTLCHAPRSKKVKAPGYGKLQTQRTAEVMECGPEFQMSVLCFENQLFFAHFLYSFSFHNNLPSKNSRLFCQFLTCAFLLSFSSSVSVACKIVIYLHNLFSGNCCDCIKFFDGCCFSVGVYRVTQLN